MSSGKFETNCNKKISNIFLAPLKRSVLFARLRTLGLGWLQKCRKKKNNRDTVCKKNEVGNRARVFGVQIVEDAIPVRVESHFKNEGIYRSIEMGGEPEKFYGAKNLVKCRIIIFFGPPGGPKTKKKVVFWHKKCEKFQI